MNIFVSNDCPHKSAKYLDDRRLNKMILESAQLLSTAINLNGGNAPYKTTHKNHPVSKWTRKSKGNYSWLLKHFIALCLEFSKRRNKVHKSQQYVDLFSNFIYLIPDGEQESFVNCTTDFKHIDNVHQAYRMQLDKKFINDGKFAFCSLCKLND